MKIQKVQIIGANNKSTNITKNQTPTAFKGGVDSLVLFWDAIGRGGFPAQFLLQDVMGANIPRTVIAFNRGKNETGKLNYVEGIETAAREFTTGPSMFIVPAIMSSLATKLTGRANNVPLQNINDFSEIMKTTIANFDKKVEMTPDALRKAFYTNVLNESAVHSFGGEKNFAEKFIETIQQIEKGDFKKRGFLRKMFDAPLKVDGKTVEAKDQVMSRLESVFSKAKQEKGSNYAADFLTAKIAKDGKETKFADLITQMKDYCDDFAKNVAPKLGEEKAPEMIEKFKNSRTGSRFLSGILLAASTALVMISIPKLYKALGKRGEKTQEKTPGAEQGGNK